MKKNRHVKSTYVTLESCFFTRIGLRAPLMKVLHNEWSPEYDKKINYERNFSQTPTRLITPIPQIWHHGSNPVAWVKGRHSQGSSLPGCVYEYTMLFWSTYKRYLCWVLCWSWNIYGPCCCAWIHNYGWCCSAGTYKGDAGSGNPKPSLVTSKIFHKRFRYCSSSIQQLPVILP